MAIERREIGAGQLSSESFKLGMTNDTQFFDSASNDMAGFY